MMNTKIFALVAAGVLTLGGCTGGDDDGDDGAVTTIAGSGDDTAGDDDDDDMMGSDYGACNACAPGEMPVQIMGLEGCFCSPACDGMTCPAVNEGTAMPACVLGVDPKMPTQCGLVCNPAMEGMCPTGATCQDTGQMGVGLCTHPAG